MRKSCGILAIVFSIALLSVSAEGVDWKDLSKQIQTNSKKINKINYYDDYLVSVEGRWKITVAHAKFPGHIARINTAQILCQKGTGICKEVMAVVFTPEDAKGTGSIPSNAFLWIHEYEYKILDWSGDDVIRARNDNPIADVELKISVKDKFAERSFRETKARGSKTSDPNIFYVWTLE